MGEIWRTLMAQSEVLTIRLAPELKDKLDALAQSTRRSKSWLAAEAIAFYIEQHLWQIQTIEEAIALADSPEAEWVEGEGFSSYSCLHR
jgi:RHH-type transcriptional regulator, rel operon repressor / antitoxin RelB